MKTRKLPTHPDARVVPVNFKTSAKEYDAIFNLAVTFASGNISEWVRRAALEYRPGPHSRTAVKIAKQGVLKKSRTKLKGFYNCYKCGEKTPNTDYCNACLATMIERNKT